MSFLLSASDSTPSRRIAVVQRRTAFLGMLFLEIYSILPSILPTVKNPVRIWPGDDMRATSAHPPGMVDADNKNRIIRVVDLALSGERYIQSVEISISSIPRRAFALCIARWWNRQMRSQWWVNL